MLDEHAQVYHKTTLIYVRAALNRHIKDLNRNFNIVRFNQTLKRSKTGFFALFSCMR
jgi:hypothetical protein